MKLEKIKNDLILFNLIGDEVSDKYTTLTKKELKRIYLDFYSKTKDKNYKLAYKNLKKNIEIADLLYFNFYYEKANNVPIEELKK